MFAHPSTIVGPAFASEVKARLLGDAARSPGSKYVLDAARRLATNANADHSPSPVPSVDCRWNGPQIGHEQLNVRDAPMAWMCTLQYLVTGDVRFATAVVRIVRAWCDVCNACVGDNRNLEASWSQINFCRSLEMLKHAWPGFKTTGIEDVYNRWVDRVMLPAINQPIAWRIYNGDVAGNWQATMCEANLQIAVFRDDRRRFERALAEYRRILPIIIKPSGLGNEILRDLCHASMAQGCLIHCCEIVHHATAGRTDLYAELDGRLAKGMEYLASVTLGDRSLVEIVGKRLELADQAWPQGSWQIGYQAYAIRKKIALPRTRQLLTLRPPVWHWLVWGHGELLAVR